jgi:hypothetical protein
MMVMMEINVVNFEIQPLVEMDTLPLIILWIPYFFTQNGERSPSLCIKRCTQLFLLQGSEYSNYYNHESAKVET